VGTTAWKFERGIWSEATSWRSDDEWGWREELRNNGFEGDPAIRLGDLDTDSFAAEAYSKAEEGKGYAVVVTIGDGGEVVLVDGLRDLLDLLAKLGPVVQSINELSGGATNAIEREYARLRKLGYPHEVADEAAHTFAEEIEAADEADREGESAE
jgi:hypothetical protein